MKDKISDTVDTARPYVERLARDEDLPRSRQEGIRLGSKDL